MLTLPNRIKNEYKISSLLSRKNSTSTLLLICCQTKEKVILKREEKYSSFQIYQILKETPIKGLPKIIDVFIEEDCLYSIQEYVDGKTLEKILEEDELSLRDIRDWSISLCQILHRLHSFNPPIIHRDIKPPNIIISKDNHPFLIDLDIAREERNNGSSDTTLLGTKPYAPPEQFGLSQTSTRSDVYALGIVIKEMLSSIPQTNNSEYRYLQFVSDKATRLDPQKRYSSMQEMERALKGKKTKIMLAALLVSICISFVLGLVYNANSQVYVSPEVLYASPTEIICTLQLPQQNTSFNPEGLFSDGFSYIISGEILDKGTFSSSLSEDSREFIIHFMASDYRLPFNKGDTLEFSIPRICFMGYQKHKTLSLK